MHRPKNCHHLSNPPLWSPLPLSRAQPCHTPTPTHTHTHAMTNRLHSPHPLIRRTAALMGLVAGFLLPWAAHAQNWQFCATEGQLCQVPAAATVRFGINGRYEYRNVNGPVPCNPQTFGDPAKGDVKQCEYRMGHNEQDTPMPPGAWPGRTATPQTNDITGWQVCALEGRQCNFRGSQEVRFGASDSYTARSATGGIACTAQLFGDPAPGLRKMCLIRPDAPWTGDNRSRGSGDGTYPPASLGQGDEGSWRFCAEEDQQCTPPRGATVRFGSPGRYAYMNRVNGSVLCHVSTFGDPSVGERKRCEYAHTAR